MTKLLTGTALALALSVGAFGAASAADKLPGNVGVEGHAAKPDHGASTDPGAGAGTYGEDRKALPGNVDVEGHGQNPAVTADQQSDPGTPDAGGNTMNTLPGNVGVEGHAQTTKETRQ